MLGQLSSLTGGGGLSGSASSSTGAIGGDTFEQAFGGIDQSGIDVWQLVMILVAVVVVVFIMARFT